MTRYARPVGAILTALALGACSGTASEQGSADSPTADLLAQPVTDGRSTPLAVDPSLAQEGAPPVEVVDLGFNRGDEDAIVKIVELSDFGCGYCRQFHQESFPAIREEFIETGMVEWKFIPFITGMFDNSLAATEASECVLEQGDEAFETMAARIWDEQRAWKSAADPAPILREWAQGAGVDMARYDGCLAEDRRIQRVASATTLARQVGVRGTPTFVVIGYPPLQGALPLAFFQDILRTVHNEERRLRAEAAAADSAAPSGG